MSTPWTSYHWVGSMHWSLTVSWSSLWVRPRSRVRRLMLRSEEKIHLQLRKKNLIYPNLRLFTHENWPTYNSLTPSISHRSVSYKVHPFYRNLFSIFTFLYPLYDPFTDYPTIQTHLQDPLSLLITPYFKQYIPDLLSHETYGTIVSTRQNKMYFTVW